MVVIVVVVVVVVVVEDGVVAGSIQQKFVSVHISPKRRTQSPGTFFQF